MLPGAVAEGDNIDESLSEIRIALGGLISSYLESDQDIPWTEGANHLEGIDPIARRWILVNV